MTTKRLSPFAKVTVATDIPKTLGNVADYLVCVEYHTIYECQNNALTVDNIKVFYTAEGTYSNKRWVGVAGQNNYYVSPGFFSSHILWLSNNGNDSNTGLSPDVPKRTIGAAVAAVTPDASNRWTIVCLEDASFSEITAVTWKRWLNLYVPNSSVTVNFIINVEDCRFVMRDFINVSSITSHISCGNNIADGAQAPVIECDNWLLSGTGAQNGYYTTTAASRCVIKVKSEMRLDRVRGIFSNNANNSSLYFECPLVNIQGIGTIFLFINSMFSRYDFNVQRIIGSSAAGQAAIQGSSGGNPFYATFNGLQEINMPGSGGKAYDINNGVRLQLGDCRVITGTKTLATGATAETTLANRYQSFTLDLPNQTPIAIKDTISIIQDSDGYIKYLGSENIAAMTIGKGASNWEHTYFVASNGNDLSSGYTAATPFRTLAAALAKYLLEYVAHLGNATIIVLPGSYNNGGEEVLSDYGNNHIINIYFCEGTHFGSRYDNTEFTSTLHLENGGQWNILGHGVFTRTNLSVDPDKVTTIFINNVNSLRIECNECGRIVSSYTAGPGYPIVRIPIVIKANKLFNGFSAINENYGNTNVCLPKVQIDAELLSGGFIRVVNCTIDSNIKLMENVQTIEMLGVNPLSGATAPIYWRHKGDFTFNFNDDFFIRYLVFSVITKIGLMACDTYIDGNIYIRGTGTPVSAEDHMNNAFIKTYNGSFILNGNLSIDGSATISYNNAHNYFDMHIGIAISVIRSELDAYLNTILGKSANWCLNTFDVNDYEYFNTLATSYKKIVHTGRRSNEYLGTNVIFPIGTKVICTTEYRSSLGTNYHVDIDRNSEEVTINQGVNSIPAFPDIFVFGLAKIHYRNLRYRSKITTEFSHRTVLLQNFAEGNMTPGDGVEFTNSGGTVLTAVVEFFDNFTKEIIVTVDSSVFRMADSFTELINRRTLLTHNYNSGILIQNVYGNERVFIGSTESINIHDIVCWSNQSSNPYHRGLITILPSINMLECLIDNIDMHLIPTTIYDDNSSFAASLLRLVLSNQQEVAGKKLSLRRLNLTGNDGTRPLHISLFNLPVIDIEVVDSTLLLKSILDFVYYCTKETSTMIGSDIRPIGPKLHFRNTFLFCNTGGIEKLIDCNTFEGGRGDCTMSGCKIITEDMIINSSIALLNESNTFVMDPLLTAESTTILDMNDFRSKAIS